MPFISDSVFFGGRKKGGKNKGNVKSTYFILVCKIAIEMYKMIVFTCTLQTISTFSIDKVVVIQKEGINEWISYLV